MTDYTNPLEFSAKRLYLEQTEKVIKLVHDFEVQESGKNIQIDIIAYPVFVPELREKIESGRFSVYMKKKGAFITRLMGDDLNNSYTLFVHFIYEAQKMFDEDFIFLSVLIDKDLVR